MHRFGLYLRAKRSWIALLAVPGVLPGSALAAEHLLLCGGPHVREVQVVEKGWKPAFELTWHWDPKEHAEIPRKIVSKFANIDDCKPTADGSEILVSSSSGAVAVVSYPEGKAKFLAEVPNAHSIAALPHDLIVAASSTIPTGNRLILFSRAISGREIFSLPLQGAHGVVWDDRRNVLWALGDKELLQLALTDANNALQVKKRYAIEDGSGHDLSLDPDGNSLILTTGARALHFAIDAESFSPYEPLAGQHGIKSIAQNPRTGQIAYTKADPGVWWTFTVRFLNPALEVPLDKETYKVRWGAPTAP